MCLAWLKHKEKVVGCRNFVVPSNNQVPLGLLDIESLGLLKIMCKVLDQQQVDRKFNSQTKKVSSATESKTKEYQQQ